MPLDNYDRLILTELQNDGSLTNASLSERVNLSPSQCSRRRATLEKQGYIEGYYARLDAAKLGFEVRAIVRVNLGRHGQETDATFSRWLSRQSEVKSAFSISGDADYVLDVRVRNLQAFSDFIHDRLLLQSTVTQVRSEFVLKNVKDDVALTLDKV